MMNFLFKPPLHENGIYSKRLADALSSHGIPTVCRTAHSDGIARCLRHFLSEKNAIEILRMPSRPLLGFSALSDVRNGDVAWVYTNQLLTDRRFCCPFERELKRKGAKYVFHLPDAWPLSSYWKPHVDARVRLADCIATVTPALTDLVRTNYPDIPCCTCEEAVATEDFDPDFTLEDAAPVVLWSGPPRKMNELREMLPVLESVHAKVSFTLRVVSGSEPPHLLTRIPVQWFPFFGTPARTRFRGTHIAFARYEDYAYGRCKGNYKIKTYLAAGCAVVTSPIGYNYEMIRENENGLFASTPEEWEAALLRLLSNPNECLSMRKAARESAIRRYSYAAIANQYACALRTCGLIHE